MRIVIPFFHGELDLDQEKGAVWDKGKRGDWICADALMLGRETLGIQQGN